MSSNLALREKTIADFGDQWGRYTDNEGRYGSQAMFDDVIGPLLDVRRLAQGPWWLISAAAFEDGSSGCCSEPPVRHVYAIEPSPGAFHSLENNVRQITRCDDVTTIHKRGDDWIAEEELDYVFSIGVVHHIPDPCPVLKTAYKSLRSGGNVFHLWLYGRGRKRILFADD